MKLDHCFYANDDTNEKLTEHNLLNSYFSRIIFSIERERERERERETERDRETEIQREIQRETERQKERHRDRETESAIKRNEF